MDTKMVEKLSSNTFKIIHSNVEKPDDEQSHHSSERPHDSQARENLEQRVNNNLGVHEQRSNSQSIEEDGYESDIDGMVTGFANIVGQLPENDIAQDLKEAELNPEQVNNAMN
jgi:acetyl-CoA carboxylase carboxyltransferase component